MKDFSIISLLFVITVFFSFCGKAPEQTSNVKTSTSPVSKDGTTKPLPKPTLNVYIENSGSMDGYVAGITEFEQAVYNFLVDIKISKIADSLNLFYINSQIIPHNSDISDFIQKLEPTTFKIRGGQRSTTDISNLLKTVLKETDSNEVAIFITDGIFSPGKDKDAAQYLVNQQVGIKSNMAEYLDKYPNTAVVIYQLSSNFNGWYYNKVDAKTKINEQRPYYIWLIGDVNYINDIIHKVPKEKFKGSGVQNVFSIASINRKVDYAIKMGSGDFKLSKQDPKTTIENLQKDFRNNKVKFSVNANLSGFLLSDDYLLNANNYEISNPNYKLNLSKAKVDKYTHQLNFESDRVHKGVLSVKLKAIVPDWVEQVNDEEGTGPVKGKTYGIKYQIYGIYEAFTRNKNYYTEIKIKII